MDQRKKEGGSGGRFHVNVVQDKDKLLDTKTEFGSTNTLAFSEVVRVELQKLMKGKLSQDPLHVNFARANDFVGIGCALDELDTADLNFWIANIGATNHICARLNMLSNLHPPAHQTLVYLPDGTSQSVQFLGSAMLSDQLVLTNVLCVPKFNYNLLSVQKLCLSSNVTFSFFSSHCIIQDLKNKSVIGVGRQMGRLYIIDKSSFDSAFIHQFSVNNVRSYSCNLSSADTTVLWHKRLGHPSFNVLKHVVSVSNSSNLEHCDVCPLAKQQRFPFSSCDTQSSACFDLVHLDVWGPYKIPSLSQCHYFLTIVDDFSRGTWTFLLHHKSQFP